MRTANGTIWAAALMGPAYATRVELKRTEFDALTSWSCKLFFCSGNLEIRAVKET